jgi:hypothetical protein
MFACSRTIAVTAPGLSYDAFDQEEIDLDEINPKSGLYWDISPYLRFRAAAFSTLKRRLVVDQTIEPTSIAGFNQFFDDANGTVSDRYAIWADLKLDDNIFVGAEASHRDLEHPISQSDGVRFQDRDENSFLAYANWTPHPQWAFVAKLRLDRFEREDDGTTGPPLRVDTLGLPLSMRFFHPAGFFAALQSTFIAQEVEPADVGGEDDFIVFDAAVGYRLPRRSGIMSLEMENIFDEDFQYQDDNFRTAGEDRRSPLIPRQTILGRVTVSF